MAVCEPIPPTATGVTPSLPQPSTSANLPAWKWVGEPALVTAILAPLSPEAVKGFRAAMHEAVAFVQNPANEQAWRKSLAKHTRLPVPVVAKIAKPNLAVDIAPDPVKFWIDICHEQHMINGNPDPASVIAQ